jgi:hypothetical protein
MDRVDRLDHGEGQSVRELFEDRNALALEFATLVAEISNEDDVPGRYRGYEAGWTVPDVDDADADAWALVWAQTPAGQVSWVVPKRLAKLSDLDKATVEHDGHTPRQRNARLTGMAIAGPTPIDYHN